MDLDKCSAPVISPPLKKPKVEDFNNEMLRVEEVNSKNTLLDYSSRDKDMDLDKSSALASTSTVVLLEDKEGPSPVKRPEAVICSSEMPRAEEVHSKETLQDYSSSDDEFLIGRRLTNEERARYYEQVKESEGYDVEYFSDADEPALITPLLIFKRVPRSYNKLKQYSILAIEAYNKEKNTDFEFVDIEKVNVQRGGQGLTFWITLTAEDMEDPDRKQKVFQAKVWGSFDQIVVYDCRLKNTSL